MNDDKTTPGRRRNTRGRLALGVAAAAGVALVATTAPVAAKNLVDTGDLAKGAVTAPKIAKKAVKPKHLAVSAVKTAKIKDGAVTEAKLAANLQPLWAVVWGGPSIVRGNGAVAVQFEGANHQYRVTFDRDVSQCSYTATLSSRVGSDPEQIGMVSVSSTVADPKAVLVRTRDHDGAAASRGFTVQVMC